MLAINVQSQPDGHRNVHTSHYDNSTCCCYDKPVRQLLIWGDKDVPKRWGIPPESESGGICLSLVIVDSHLLTGAPMTTQGWLSLPTADVLSTIVKQSMLTDVDKMSSCSRFSDSVVGFTGQKTQPTAPKYWRSNCHFTLITGYLSGLYHYWLWNRKNIWIVLSGL